MLKHRLVPKLQLRASKIGTSNRMVLVTTVAFREFIEVGDAVSQARIYEAQAVDELIFVDIDAARERRLANVSIVERAAEEVFMPFCVGGGVTSVDDVRRLLGSGADKVSINTAAVDNHSLLSNAAEAFGAQCVVLSIDAKLGDNGDWRVYTHGGSVPTQLTPTEWARQGEHLGAGEIMLTSIDRDGSRLGLDIALTRSVVDSVSIPVIASGGCGRAEHFVEGFLDGGADAVASGTYFSFRDENPMQTRSQIRNAGVEIRLLT